MVLENKKPTPMRDGAESRLLCRPSFPFCYGPDDFFEPLALQPVVGAGDGDVVVMFGGKVYREDALATLCQDVISGGGGRGGRSVETRGGGGSGGR